jgi:hypothetical protein
VTALAVVAKADPVWAALLRVAQWYAPRLADAFLAVAKTWRVGVDVSALETALAAGDVEGVVRRLLGAPEVATQTWGPYLQAVHQALLDYGMKAAEDVPEVKTLYGPVLRVHFDVGHPATQALLQQHDLRFIREVDLETRAGIRTYLQAALGAGKNPRSLINELVGVLQQNDVRDGGIAGLTERQSRAIWNYRRSLEGLDRDALRRALRDRRYDRTVDAAIRTERPLTTAQVDQLVNRYTSRWLRYRAETIARTESLRAQADGQRAMWEQAIAAGQIRAEDVVKRWTTAHDERVRPGVTSKGVERKGVGLMQNHRQMDDQRVPFNAEFVAPDTGERTWGPPYGPNCRCLCWIRPRVGAP